MLRTTVSVLALSAALFASAASAEIGVLAAANRDIDGARPSEPARPLLIKDKIVANERITSSAIGGGQILFLDQTSLTISPNSDIVLDKYVYDPNSQSGELGITVLKGALRMVGGRITKTKPALIKTPSATIGIRGGMGNTVVNPDGSTTYTHVAGIESKIQTEDQELSITRQGGHARIGADGGIEYLGIAPPEVVKGAYGGGSSGEGNGGSGESGKKAESNPGVQQVEEQVSGKEETKTAPPLTTTGKTQEPAQPAAETRLRTPVTTDEAAESVLVANVDESVDDDTLGGDDTLDGGDVVDGVDQIFDSVTFAGTFTVEIDASSGSIASGAETSVQARTSTQNFELLYSLQTDEGLFGFTLPSGDVGADINEFTPDDLAEEDPVIAAFISALGVDENNPGDGALITGIQSSSGSVFFSPDAITETFAGGEVSTINLVSDADNNLTGSFVFDYTQDPAFVEVTQIAGGVNIAGAGLEDGAAGIQTIRDAFEAEFLEPDDPNIPANTPPTQ